MKYLFFVYCLLYLSGCSTYKPILTNNIKNVHVLFTDSTWAHHEGYKLYDGVTIGWDKMHIGVKAALKSYSEKKLLLKTESPDYLERFIVNNKRIKYRPIKVVPLREFGYIEMKTNELIFYGIMGQDIFIDLSNYWIYY